MEVYNHINKYEFMVNMFTSANISIKNIRGSDLINETLLKRPDLVHLDKIF